MDTQELMQRLMATINADREERKADRKADQAKADAHQEEMNANTKTMLAEIKADKEEMLAAIKANKETTTRMDANMRSMRAELKSTIEEDIKDAMHSMRSELDETIRQRIQTEVTGKIEKARMKLQAVELSLDKQTKKFREDLTKVDIEAKATRKEALAQQRLMNEKIEAEMRELRARLEEVGAVPQQGSIPALGASTIQPPTFDGKGTWSVFRRQYEIVAEHNR
jgi:hypothetical protein